MKKMSTLHRMLAATLLAGSALVVAAPAHASVFITEFSYQSAVSDEKGEYIELTNTGVTDVDFTGWSYDDDSRTSLTFNLSEFGVVRAGESVIITEIDPDLFRTRWNLDSSVKVIGFMAPNFARADEVNIYDAQLNLVDRLTYGDNTIGGVRPRFNAARPGSFAELGQNNIHGWVLSSVGDADGSWTSTVGDVGSPGFSSLVTPVPEPEAYALLLAGLGLVGGAVARRRRTAALPALVPAAA
ncbi:lamin tail domain-containing protein [Hydrogenophaga sp. ANAO-22]|jgi:predicted extracellular nuclease|uniref:lamin tail domain-containing protein n=1 Tax=Hydrogenophaga sp. ANAO-22 TaxID=3166645 RepID=UPI0036D429FF